MPSLAIALRSISDHSNVGVHIKDDLQRYLSLTCPLRAGWGGKIMQLIIVVIDLEFAVAVVTILLMPR